MDTIPCDSYGHDKNNADACENGLVTTESTQVGISQSAHEQDPGPYSYPGTSQSGMGVMRSHQEHYMTRVYVCYMTCACGGHLHGRLAEDRG